MKLGEARQRLKLLKREVFEISKMLPEGPITLLPALLEKCNTRLQEAQELDRKIKGTSRSLGVEESPLEALESTLEVVSDKLSVLEKLETRKDISPEQRENLFTDIIKVRATRDELELRVATLLWEVDVLE